MNVKTHLEAASRNVIFTGKKSIQCTKNKESPQLITLTEPVSEALKSVLLIGQDIYSGQSATGNSSASGSGSPVVEKLYDTDPALFVR